MFAASKTASVSGGYQISRSLRFNAPDSAYLNRTPASATNRKTWTYSAWVKRSKSGDFRTIFSAATDTSNLTIIRFKDDDKIEVRSATAGSTVFQLVTTQVFRDYSAWYHFVLAVDTTNATGGDRVRLYVNGSEVTTFDTDTIPTQNADSWVNNNILHEIARQANNASNYYQDGYMTEMYLIDGSQLTPSSFGETNAQTGVWQPKAYSGSYGTNGFYLNFSDNSNTTAATLGKDYSGNGNNWTPNNFSVTAGAGNDSLVDSPTSYGSDSGAGGEVRGNYSTMNPLDNYNTNAAVAFTFANGNLDVSRSNQSWASSRSTMAMSSGKWYAEMTVTASTAGTLNAMFGIAKQDFTINDYFGGQAGGYGYNAANGQKYNGGSGVSYGATFTTNDVIGVAYDADAGSLVFYKNGTSQGTAYTGLSGTFCFAIGLFPQTSGSITATLNCGQRPFAYTAPSGYKALCTQNLPTPTIGATTATQASQFFAPVIYTGTGATQTVTVGFETGLLWGKERSSADRHWLADQVRGLKTTGYYLLTSNNTNADTSSAAPDGVTAITSTGFTLGANTSNTDGNWSYEINQSGSSYVAWNWKANGSGSTNTAGSITSTVSANTTSGFSVVTYTGTGANATIGHGLGVAPSMIISKSRSNALDWDVYHSALGPNYWLRLNSTIAAVNNSAMWRNVSPTSTVWSIGTDTENNTNGATYVAYVFAEVAGYSKFGSYTGNGSSDGPFVYTGMRPAYVMYKKAGAGTSVGDWVVIDTQRDTYNVTGKYLAPNASQAESNDPPFIDILSNGFKVRRNSAGSNENGVQYIFAAFAESPQKFSLAR